MHCFLMQHAWQVRTMHGSSCMGWCCHYFSANQTSGATGVSSKSELNKPTTFETTQPIPVQEEVGDPWPISDGTSPERVHKKRKWGTTATDEIDVLFEGVFGCKVTQSALEQETAQSLSRLEEKDTKHGGARVLRPDSPLDFKRPYSASRAL
jgi:hypothetical protein